MKPDDLVWNQIAEIHEYLRLIGTQGVTWFVFGFGADAAALWAILANNISLRTKNVPYALALFNLMGAIFCFLTPFYYHHAAMNINSLTECLSAQTEANDSTTTAHDSTAAASEKHAGHLHRLLIKHPAFSWVLWSLVSCLMGVVLIAVTVLWIVYNRDGYLINRNGT